MKNWKQVKKELLKDKETRKEYGKAWRKYINRFMKTLIKTKLLEGK